MPPRDFRQGACATRSQDALPMPVDEANLDYHLLEELDVATDEGEEPRRVARDPAVAAAREMVDAFVRRRAARRPAPRPASTCCRSRWSAPGRPVAWTPAGEVEAIVDIGADVVSVVVHAGGVPRYVRIIPGIGGDADHPRPSSSATTGPGRTPSAPRSSSACPGHARLDAGQQRGRAAPAATASTTRPRRSIGAAGGRPWSQEIVTTLDFYRASAAEAAGDRRGSERRRAGCVLAGAGRPARRAARAARGPARPPRRDARRPHGRPRAAQGAGHRHDLPSLAVPAGLCVGASR